MSYDIIVEEGRTNYRVEINDKTIIVKHAETRDELLKLRKYYKVFIGKDTDPEGAFFDGSSILVKTGRFEYVYIGDTIYRFWSKAEIVEYHSIIGDKCKPYPYAIDENYNHYLMLDKVLCNFGEILVTDPYEVYRDKSYDNRAIIYKFPTVSI